MTTRIMMIDAMLKYIMYQAVQNILKVEFTRVVFACVLSRIDKEVSQPLHSHHRELA